MAVLNHIFIDYENMRQIDSAVFALDRATITLLLGPQNGSISTTTVQQLMAHAASVELVRLEKSGKHAVDLALAYYMGRKVIADPLTFLHIVSRDKGYDPLIEHLRSRQIKVCRHEDYAALAKALKPKSPPSAPKTKKPGRPTGSASD